MKHLLALAGLLALGACASDGSSFELPLFGGAAPLVPVEGLESTEIVPRASGAVLSARGHRPIEVLALPAQRHTQHPVRGEVVALAGPARDGRFVYAVQDEDRRLRLRRGSISGADRPVTRLERPVHALSISADGARAALLAPFPEGDPRSRGDVLRELVVVDLDTGVVTPTAFACWPWPPAWIDAQHLAVVTATEQGAREVHSLDLTTTTVGPVLASGEAALVQPDGVALVVAARDQDGAVTLSRVPLDGTPATTLAARGVLAPLAVLPDGLVVAWSAPTLGAPKGVELGVLRPSVALGTIKLHDLATGSFATVEPSASPRRLWSAGALGSAR